MNGSFLAPLLGAGHALVFNVVSPAARKTEVGNAVSSAVALSCDETFDKKLELD